MRPIEMITEPALLEEAASSWRQLPLLGCDTEFERSRTFHARPALLQVFDGKRSLLVDPLATPLTPFLKILTESGVEKIFHSASEDMEMLFRLAGERPRAIFDTQIAAGLAGMGASLSYQDLVQQLCGATLAKSQTRSDWLRRPLSDAQIEYAALDVVYLIDMRQRLIERLEGLGRLDWLREDCERMVADACSSASAEALLPAFKLAWKLDPVSRAVLLALIDWRERQARARDLPRRHVIDDEAMLRLAQERPASADAVAEAASLGRHKRESMADSLCDLIRDAGTTPPEACPPQPPRPLDREQRKQMQRLKDIVARQAEELGIEPNLLVNKKELTALQLGNPLPPRLKGWRYQLIGRRLEEERA